MDRLAEKLWLEQVSSPRKFFHRARPKLRAYKRAISYFRFALRRFRFGVLIDLVRRLASPLAIYAATLALNLDRPCPGALFKNWTLRLR